jgi:GNAT superfamily N-acetyltransferase
MKLLDEKWIGLGFLVTQVLVDFFGIFLDIPGWISIIPLIALLWLIKEIRYTETAEERKNREKLRGVIELGTEAFYDTPGYKGMSYRKVRSIFKKALNASHTNISIRSDGTKVITFLQYVDYWKTKEEDEALWRFMFKKFMSPLELAYMEEVIRSGDYIYIVSVATAPSHRRKGYAKRAIENLLEDKQEYGFIADVTEPALLGTFESLGFEILETFFGRTYVWKENIKK